MYLSDGRNKRPGLDKSRQKLPHDPLLGLEYTIYCACLAIAKATYCVPIEGQRLFHTSQLRIGEVFPCGWKQRVQLAVRGAGAAALQYVAGIPVGLKEVALCALNFLRYGADIMGGVEFPHYRCAEFVVYAGGHYEPYAFPYRRRVIAGYAAGFGVFFIAVFFNTSNRCLYF